MNEYDWFLVGNQPVRSKRENPSENDKYSNWYRKVYTNENELYNNKTPTEPYYSTTNKILGYDDEYERKEEAIRAISNELKLYAEYKDKQKALDDSRQNIGNQMKMDYNGKVIDLREFGYIGDGYDHNNPDRVRGPPIITSFRTYHAEEQDENYQKYKRAQGVIIPEDYEVIDVEGRIILK